MVFITIWKEDPMAQQRFDLSSLVEMADNGRKNPGVIHSPEGCDGFFNLFRTMMLCRCPTESGGSERSAICHVYFCTVTTGPRAENRPGHVYINYIVRRKPANGACNLSFGVVTPYIVSTCDLAGPAI